MGGFRVAVQLEYFDNPLPNRLALKNLFYGHALLMGRFNPVQFADYVFQFLDVGHGFFSVAISKRTINGASA